MQTEQSQRQQNQLMVQTSRGLSFSCNFSKEDDGMSRFSLSTFRAKEEQIERKKMEVRQKVDAQLCRAEEETKRLALIHQAPRSWKRFQIMRKEVGQIRKRIDALNKELKPLGHACQKKEREYREAVDALKEKSKEIVPLMTKLMELASESERLRMKKLEELNKNVNVVSPM